MKIALRINGEQHEADLWEGESLLFALRERLGLPGSKIDGSCRRSSVTPSAYRS